MVVVLSAFAEDGSFYAVYSDFGALCHFDCCIIFLYKADRKTADVQHEPV